MSGYLSEDDLQTFEGYLRGQAVDPAAATPRELEMWRGYFDQDMERIKAAPKVGLMKFKQDPAEQRYAVALRKAAELWLTFWVRCKPNGEVFGFYPGGVASGNAHVSYHLSGRSHQKSHGHAFMIRERQPLTAAFSGSEHLGIYGGHGTGTGAVCNPKEFDGVLIVSPGILGPRDGAVGVDLVEEGHLPVWERGMGVSMYVGGIDQREVFLRPGRPAVVITITQG